MTALDQTGSIEITVKVFGGLRQSFPSDRPKWRMPAGSQLADLLDQLASELPSLTVELTRGLEAGYLNVLVNGRNSRFLGGQQAPLKDGDTVAFLPPVGGG